MSKVWKLITGRVKRLFNTDLLFIIGAGLGFYGVYQVYQPAAYILLGGGCIYLGIQAERRKTKT